MRQFKELDIEYSASNDPPTIAESASTFADKDALIPHSTNHERKDAYILQLPDELLLSVVEFVVYEQNAYIDSVCPACTQLEELHMIDQKSAKALALVCSRLRRISQPVLFREIRFVSSEESVPPSISVLRLHRTLQENNELRRHCRSLFLPISSFSKKTAASYKVVKNFANWLTSIRCLSIYGGFEDENGISNEHTWSLIRRFVTNFDQVEHLFLCRSGDNLYLAPILKWAKFPKLSHLSLQGLSEGKGEDRELILENQRSAPVTSIDLIAYEDNPENTRTLLLWPATLTHFSFESFYNNPHIMDYPLLESMLLPHAQTLKRISLGSLSNRNNDSVFNASLFPALEYLGLSRWQLPSPLHFRSEDANILGPSVKTFALDFTINDQGSEGWQAFAKEEADWIEAIAQAAVLRRAPLQCIKIQFSPDHWGSKEDMGYPWDLMDDLNERVLETNGMRLAYNKPTIKKAAWLEHVREWEERERLRASVVEVAFVESEPSSESDDA